MFSLTYECYANRRQLPYRLTDAVLSRTPGSAAPAVWEGSL